MDEDFNPFANERFRKDFADGKITKLEKYPKGIDEFDKLILDFFMELNVKKKNLSVNVFEKICLRKYIEQTTNKTFMARLNRFKEMGIPIKTFDKETHAECIGYNPNEVKE